MEKQRTDELERLRCTVHINRQFFEGCLLFVEGVPHSRVHLLDRCINSLTRATIQ